MCHLLQVFNRSIPCEYCNSTEECTYVEIMLYTHKCKACQGICCVNCFQSCDLCSKEDDNSECINCIQSCSLCQKMICHHHQKQCKSCNQHYCNQCIQYDACESDNNKDSIYSDAESSRDAISIDSDAESMDSED